MPETQPTAPISDALDDDVVEAGEEHEAVADHVADVDEAPRVAGGILEADDRLDVGERGQNVRRDVVLVDRRIVVEHDGRSVAVATARKCAAVSCGLEE